MNRNVLEFIFYNYVIAYGRDIKFIDKTRIGHRKAK